METFSTKPEAYNNIYEESKHLAEDLVVHFCRSRRIGYRIFRPSIIIGHSQTFQSSSGSGFYQAVELAKGFHDMIVARSPGFFDQHTLKICSSREATANMTPVDIVVSEMLDLASLGVRTLAQVFHITSESPISLQGAFQIVFRVVGIHSFEFVGHDEPLSVIDRSFNRAISQYAPYWANRKIFDRSNVAMHGVDHHQVNFVLDVDRQQYSVTREGRERANPSQTNPSNLSREVVVG